MNPRLLLNRVISTCVLISLVATYSMVALANSETVSGKIIFTENESVIINGETAKTGQTIFTSSTIITPDTTSAIINIGKLGSIELAPKTTLNLTFSEKAISGELINGKLTVLNAAERVNIVTPKGMFKKLSAGESAVAGNVQDDDDDDDDDDGGYLWIGLGVFGAAVAGAIFAVYSDDDSDLNLAGTGLVFSPN